MDRPDIPDFFSNPNRQFNQFDPDKFLKNNIMLIGLVILAFFILPNLLIVVGAGQRAVLFNRVTGMEERVLGEGVQLVVPVLQQATVYDVREISYIFNDNNERSRRGAFIMGNSIHTLTADGQSIDVDVTVRARPSFKDLWWLHQQLGKDNYNSYVEKIIVPVVRSVVREVISGYTVSAIYSEDRKAIATKIEEAVGSKLSEYKIVQTELLLNEVKFSKAYQEAIEEKQQARIELDTKDNIIVEEKNKRDAVITRALGEAQAIKLKVSSLTSNPDYLKYRKAQILGKRTKLIVEQDL